jgi:hypothetical protein
MVRKNPTSSSSNTHKRGSKYSNANSLVADMGKLGKRVGFENISSTPGSYTSVRMFLTQPKYLSDVKRSGEIKIPPSGNLLLKMPRHQVGKDRRSDVERIDMELGPLSFISMRAGHQLHTRLLHRTHYCHHTARVSSQHMVSIFIRPIVLTLTNARRVSHDEFI